MAVLAYEDLDFQTRAATEGRPYKAFNSAVILQSQFSPELKPPERMRRTSNRRSRRFRGNFEAGIIV